MNSNFIKFPFILIACLFLAGCSSESYDECVLKNIKPGYSDAAVGQIRLICQSKSAKITTDKPCQKRALTAEEFEKLIGAATIYVDERLLKLVVYNGNEKLVITSITVEIANKGGDKRRYLLSNLNILPLSDSKVFKEIPSVEPSEANNVKMVGADVCL